MRTTRLRDVSSCVMFTNEARKHALQVLPCMRSPFLRPADAWCFTSDGHNALQQHVRWRWAELEPDSHGLHSVFPVVAESDNHLGLQGLQAQPGRLEGTQRLQVGMGFVDGGLCQGNGGWQ